MRRDPRWPFGGPSHAAAVSPLRSATRSVVDGADDLPGAAIVDEAVLTLVGSDGGGWSRSPGEQQNDSRKRFYNRAIEVVAGEKNSDFVRAVMAAEATSLVTNLGTRGVGYINGDLTVALARLRAVTGSAYRPTRTGHQTGSPRGRRRFSTSPARSDPA
jgi:hypothetical protein